MDGRTMAPSKIEKLKHWPTPCPNIKSLRGFLGLANYLRKSLPDFAFNDAPLRAITGKRSTWLWTKECSEAMDKINNEALLHRVLVNIDYLCDREIILAVDSKFAAG